MLMQKRPAVDFVYWLSGFRGMPISSKAQWDQNCPNGEADYGELGYCVQSRDAVYEKSARTGPYEYVSFQEGVGWEWSRVTYDHHRVNPDFSEIEIKDVREPATRLAIMQAREAHIGSVNRALLQDATDDGLEVVDSSVTATMAWAIFGGLYYSTGETPEGYVEEFDIVGHRDEEMPWNIPGETGRTIRIAMNKAIDRDAINEAIFGGAGEHHWIGGIIPDFPAGYNPDWEGKWDELYGYDPEAAKELLAEAGYPTDSLSQSLRTRWAAFLKYPICWKPCPPIGRRSVWILPLSLLSSPIGETSIAVSIRTVASIRTADPRRPSTPGCTSTTARSGSSGCTPATTSRTTKSKP